MDTILNAIQNGSWEEALELFLEYTKIHELNEDLCVIGATILEQFGEMDDMFSLVQSGIRFNPYNHELYLLLGNYYTRFSPEKALLTYKQALLYAEKNGKEEDAAVIRQIMENYEQESGAELRKTTILVLADEDKKRLDECLEGIDNTCVKDIIKVQVVDVSDFEHRVETLNKAVADSDKSDNVFLLSCDAVLTPNALYNLQIEMYDKEELGAASCVSNYAFYKQVPEDNGVRTPRGAVRYAEIHNYPRFHACEMKMVVDNSFVLLRREAIDKVFPLDPSFVAEGYTNLDFGLRMIDAGYKNAVCWNSFVFHYIRNEVSEKNSEYIEEGKKKIKEKWGFSPEYYMNTREDIVSMIERDKNETLDVLEVGAGLGSTLSRIKYKFPNARVHGIEIVEAVAAMAKKNTDMKCTNIETYEFEEGEVFDYIIFGDVLEHLVDPFTLVDRLKNNLKPGGSIIASIPNIMNANVVYELLHGNFTYQDAGILDRTHLRFFTKNEVIKLFQERGYKITQMIGSTHPSEAVAVHQEFFDKLLAIEGIAERGEFEIVQYIVNAEKIR